MPDQRDITKSQFKDNAGFWQEGWQKGFTGFHQSDYNPTMKEFFKDQDLKDKTILVPLCGKSLDMIYLASHGAQVIGVEVVESPIIEFFEENQISYKREKDIFKSEKITIHKADFFKMENLGNIDYLYDRASNVALPPCMRKEKYYPTIKRLISKKTKILLLTMDHDGPQDFGPPYAVAKEEIRKQYPQLKLVKEDSAKAMDRFQSAGIKKIKRYIWANQ